MKKFSLFIVLSLSGTPHIFAQDAGRMMRSISPEAIVAAGLGGLLFLLGLLLSYIALSYWIYLLSRKYAPKLHPAWSWIPIAQIYPLVVVSGQSLWWILVILLAWFIIPVIGGLVSFVGIVYIYYWLAKRLGRDVGTTILLVFFPVLMIPYLGLQAHKKPTTLAWVLWIGSIVATCIGLLLGAAGTGTALFGIERRYDFMDRAQRRIMREIRENPELERQFQEVKDRIETNTEIQDALIKMQQKGEISTASE